jgi:hypothetical protein
MSSTKACSRVLFEKPRVPELDNNLPAVYGTRGFIIVFAKMPPLVSNTNQPTEFIPHISPYRISCTLPPTPESSKQSLPFTLSDRTFVTIPHLTHACYMPHHFVIFDLIVLIMMFDAGYHLRSPLCILPSFTFSFRGQTFTSVPDVYFMIHVSKYLMSSQNLHLKNSVRLGSKMIR